VNLNGLLCNGGAENARVGNARVENVAPDTRAGKRGSIIDTAGMCDKVITDIFSHPLWSKFLTPEEKVEHVAKQTRQIVSFTS